MDTVLTTCPFCPSGCGFYLYACDGRPAGVMASERHPASRGRLCARGWSSHEASAWGERLTAPLVRHDGRLRPVSWEVALEAAVEGMVSTWRGGRAIGVLGSARATNEENYLAARLARGALQTPHVDSCLAATYRPLLDGLAGVTGRHAGRGTIADLEGSEVILLFEGDVAATHPQVAGAIVRAVKAGSRLVVVGSVATQMARLAALRLTVPPGRERGIACGLVAEVIAAGQLDTAAVVSSGSGFETLRRSVAGIKSGETVSRAALWYARSTCAAIVVAPLVGGEGELRQLAGDLATLAGVTGHLDREGSALLILPVRGNLRGACEVGVSPDLLPGFAPLDDDETYRRLHALWGVAPVRERGLGAADLIAECRGLVIVADDPVSVMPSPAAARAALKAKDCVVVLDAFATAALDAATVVLPIASFAENHGTVTGLDGRVQRVRAAAPLPGEARPGWAVLADMLRRLGSAAEYHSADEVRQEIALVVPSQAGARWQDLDDGWGVIAPDRGLAGLLSLAALPPPAGPEGTQAVAVWDGVFDWGSDPLVRYSPTLCRDAVAQRKLFPRGVVEMSKEEMERLGVRQGWSVRVRSQSGEAVAPAVVRPGLAPGVVVVPYACREALAAVMGGGIAQVAVERA